MQQLSLNFRLDRIGQHIVRAKLFLDLWIYFEGQDTRPKILDTMRDYNEFFRFAPHAFFSTYVIYISGIFDKRKGTISLTSLIAELKKLGNLNATDLSDIDDLLAQARPAAEKITILRHNAFAHRSANISYNDMFQKAHIKPDELRELTDVTLKIINRLLRAHGLSEQYFTNLPRESAEAMMTTLAAKKCRDTD